MLARYGLWLCHGALLAAAATGIATAELDARARIVLLAAAIAPLLAAIPGLWRRRRYTYQWLMIVLVLFVGIAAVEVVATLGASVAATLTLLAALAELALLLALVRRGDPPRAPRG